MYKPYLAYTDKKNLDNFGVNIIFFISLYFSSLSTSLNSMSAVVLEDFYKPFYSKELSDRQTAWLMRGVVILLGALCVGK